MKYGGRVWSLGILSALLLFSVPSSTLADYVCWPFGSTPLSGFPSCTNNKLDVNATVSGGATPIPLPTFPWPVTWPSALPVHITDALPTPNPIQTQPFKVFPGTIATPAAQATIASSITSVTVLAANAARNGFTICNSSTSDAYVNFAATAILGPPFWQHYPSVIVSSTAVEPCFTLVGVGVYRGPVSAIWTAANGFLVVTEW